jgi:hypothetical protein
VRRILRRYVTRDPAGRVVSIRSERLTDDGAGYLRLHSEQSAQSCSGCNRPVIEVSELRGICDWCGRRECCSHCIARCQVCSRRLCGHCRRGFGGSPTLTVCPSCRQQLVARQWRQDQLTAEQVAFDRHMAQQRLINQVEALRLMAERMHIQARFEAVRMGLCRQSTFERVLWLPRLVMVKAFNGIQHVVRLALS